MKKFSGFTLIELLIVVLIIAILAAIAVPNFLEFQVRAKVARAQTDMRNISIALEAYSVDNDRYPVGFMNIRQFAYENVEPTAYWGRFLSGYEDRIWHSMSYLTTPVAYLNSIFLDVFSGGGIRWSRFNEVHSNPLPYWYDDFQAYPKEWKDNDPYVGYCYSTWKQIHDEGNYVWLLWSIGPERFGSEYGAIALHGRDPPVPTDGQFYFAYDPTNGTISNGLVGRTNKGVFTEVTQKGIH